MSYGYPWQLMSTPGKGLLLNGIQEVRGSIPLSSTISLIVTAVMGWTPPDGIDVPEWRC